MDMNELLRRVTARREAKVVAPTADSDYVEKLASALEYLNGTFTDEVVERDTTPTAPTSRINSLIKEKLAEKIADRVSVEEVEEDQEDILDSLISRFSDVQPVVEQEKVAEESIETVEDDTTADELLEKTASPGLGSSLAEMIESAIQGEDVSDESSPKETVKTAGDLSTEGKLDRAETLALIRSKVASSFKR